MKDLVLKKTQRFVWACLVMALVGMYMLLPVRAEGSSAKEGINAQKVKLVVVDETDGVALNGAEFLLTLIGNENVGELEVQTDITVSQDGAELGVLAAGAYRLTQLTAPNGYVITSKAAEFTVTTEGVRLSNDVDNVQITQQGDTYVLTVANMIGFIVRLPSTGGSGDMPYLLGGMLCMLSAVIGMLILRYKRTAGLLVVVMACFMTQAAPVTVKAAEPAEDWQSSTEVPVYTYYLMMKASDGSKGEAYYVEDEALANALLTQNIRGERVFHVTKQLGTDYWIAALNGEAEFTEAELGAVLADLKELAVASGTVQKNVIELEENGLIYIESDRGEQFVLTGELPEAAAARVKSQKPNVQFLLQDENGVTYPNYAEIGEAVTCKICVTIPKSIIKDMYDHNQGFGEFTITNVVSEGLDIGAISEVAIGKTGEEEEISGDALTQLVWQEVQEDVSGQTAGENKTYALELGTDYTEKLFPTENFSGYDDVVVEITYTAVLNDKARVGEPETNQAKFYAASDQSSDVPVTVMQGSVESEVRNLYTFGFELDTVDGNDNALPDMGFTLTRTGDAEETYYYTLFEETQTGEKVRFQPNACVVATDTDGKIAFSGLSAGTYTLTQTKAYDGYKVLENPIEVTIGTDGSLSINGNCGSAENTENGSETVEGQETVYYYGTLKLKYTDGVEIPDIPSTGGMGTGGYYMTGILFMLVAGLLLAVRKRQGLSV